jgi:predicted ArsR family transcriptional regulator
MIKLPVGIEIEEIPVEKKYRSITNALIKRIKHLYDAIYERYGSVGLDLIREVSTNYGLEMAERAKQKIKHPDIKSVGLFVIKVFNNLRGNGEVTEFNEDKVVIRVYECPYPFDKPEMCEAHTSMEKALVETLCKDLKYYIDKSIPKGDAYCDHGIERIR